MTGAAWGASSGEMARNAPSQPARDGLRAVLHHRQRRQDLSFQHEPDGLREAKRLTTEETSVLLTGQGTVNVTADEQLDVDLLGAGAVFYKGDPQKNVRITGAGSVVDAN